jgi:nucleoside-diphosphate-sugar epimerase
MTRVLVTGASGFIGQGTLAPLLAAGFEVHAVTARGRDGDALAGVRWERADLLSPSGADELMRRVEPTHLLHLAWYAEPGAFWESVENLRWLEASLRVFRAFAERGGQRAVFAGSCAEYAWADRVHCIESETPCRPATLYGTTKHALRLVAERYAENVGVSLAWGRVFFVFGPREHQSRLAGSVARSLVLGRPAPLSHGNQVRDFLYSEDLADAFVALLRSEVEGPVNLASGTPVRIRELAEALAGAAQRPDLLRFGELTAPSGEPLALSAAVGRLRDEVEWAPQATLEQRAADTIAWWRSELKAGDLRRARV